MPKISPVNSSSVAPTSIPPAGRFPSLTRFISRISPNFRGASQSSSSVTVSGINESNSNQVASVENDAAQSQSTEPFIAQAEISSLPLCKMTPQEHVIAQLNLSPRAIQWHSNMEDDLGDLRRIMLMLESGWQLYGPDSSATAAEKDQYKNLLADFSRRFEKFAICKTKFSLTYPDTHRTSKKSLEDRQFKKFKLARDSLTKMFVATMLNRNENRLEKVLVEQQVREAMNKKLASAGIAGGVQEGDNYVDMVIPRDYQNTKNLVDLLSKQPARTIDYMDIGMVLNEYNLMPECLVNVGPVKEVPQPEDAAGPSSGKDNSISDGINTKKTTTDTSVQTTGEKELFGTVDTPDLQPTTSDASSQVDDDLIPKTRSRARRKKAGVNHRKSPSRIYNFTHHHHIHIHFGSNHISTDGPPKRPTADFTQQADIDANNNPLLMTADRALTVSASGNSSTVATQFPDMNAISSLGVATSGIRTSLDVHSQAIDSPVLQTNIVSRFRNDPLNSSYDTAVFDSNSEIRQQARAVNIVRQAGTGDSFANMLVKNSRKNEDAYRSNAEFENVYRILERSDISLKSMDILLRNASQRTSLAGHELGFQANTTVDSHDWWDGDLDSLSDSSLSQSDSVYDRSGPESIVGSDDDRYLFPARLRTSSMGSSVSSTSQLSSVSTFAVPESAVLSRFQSQAHPPSIVRRMDTFDGGYETQSVDMILSEEDADETTVSASALEQVQANVHKDSIEFSSPQSFSMRGNALVKSNKGQVLGSTHTDLHSEMDVLSGKKNRLPVSWVSEVTEARNASAEEYGIADANVGNRGLVQISAASLAVSNMASTFVKRGNDKSAVLFSSPMNQANAIEPLVHVNKLVVDDNQFRFHSSFPSAEALLQMKFDPQGAWGESIGNDPINADLDRRASIFSDFVSTSTIQTPPESESINRGMSFFSPTRSQPFSSSRFMELYAAEAQEQRDSEIEVTTKRNLASRLPPADFHQDSIFSDVNVADAALSVRSYALQEIDELLSPEIDRKNTMTPWTFWSELDKKASQSSTLAKSSLLNAPAATPKKWEVRSSPQVFLTQGRSVSEGNLNHVVGTYRPDLPQKTKVNPSHWMNGVRVA
ncbi:hypothetical protein RGU70_08595 [Herbaspirillum sp. RTI4]|uniref:hypothetical protein n=1 Tax=Herbaspirillum sp. RTI4 TaxID=3048640 RepID=UPI002AB5385C|nr:hypothetical protein [Herbaspirillum sp. RTI4]MDY7578379.1 hypothetical protein [Herbaspirillum sp. RTI4]MEA9983564.1 hypothetical protein [Herbaspirillum sp. RTI4]